MEFSLRTIRQYHKAMKSKKSINCTDSREHESDPQIQKSFVEKIIGLPENHQLKIYQDRHLFKTNFSSMESSAESSRNPLFSHEKTSIQQYEPFSRKRDIKRLTNMSYKMQKIQRSQKTQKAIEDLKKIGSISVNHFERNPQDSVRFNKEIEESDNERHFKRWRTLTQQKSRKLKSPTKLRVGTVKRAKNSPKKGSLSLRIRKTFFNNSKGSECLMNLSTVESQNKETESLKPVRRKSSIAPWEIDEQDFN